MSDADQPHARERVLAALKQAGPAGVTTWNLIHEARHSRAVGRVWELRTQHDIEHVREPNNVHRWIYRGVRPEPSLLPLMGER